MILYRRQLIAGKRGVGKGGGSRGLGGKYILRFNVVMALRSKLLLTLFLRGQQVKSEIQDYLLNPGKLSKSCREAVVSAQCDTVLSVKSHDLFLTQFVLPSTLMK